MVSLSTTFLSSLMFPVQLFCWRAATASLENALGGNVRQLFNLRKGLTQELAKKIVADIKDSKLKVQASIQGEQVRVSGKSKDDLQSVIQLLRANEDKYDYPLQFTNYR